MDQGYQYSPLDPKNRQIRLVTLESGAWSDDICCSIDVVSFDGRPIYEALSYVWGDPKDRKDIRLNDHLFDITENLWMVLRRLRDPVVSRVLWIDAIYINQKDNDEKSHQVAMMGKIYSSRQKAIIWLGEDLDTTEAGSKSIVASRACEMLEMLGAGRYLDQLPCFSASDGQ